MEAFLWIVGGIITAVIWGVYQGGKKERIYRQIIAELIQELAHDPSSFFYPCYQFSPNNKITGLELTELLLKKIMLEAIERKVRLPINANLIPSDIKDLPDVNQDFRRLYALAYSIANDRD